MTFRGFPPEGVDFYVRLRADNSKAFWAANRSTYDDAVLEPLRSLTEELADEFGTFHLFRPYRDVRFSKDKKPYKDHQGAVTEGEGGEAYYLHLGPDGLFVATGYHQMARDQLERYRAAVVDDAAGPQLVDCIDALEAQRYEIGGSELVTAPRGFPRDHARVRFLRHKGLTAARSFGSPAWLSTRAATDRIVDAWRGASSMNDWLDRRVGPSQMPPPERR
jgi:uncharacterized protein (TIGR02453 family)